MKINKKNPVKKNPLFFESTDYTDEIKKNPVNPVKNPVILSKKIRCLESTDYTDENQQKKSCESCQNPVILSKKNPLFFESTDYTDFTDEINKKKSCQKKSAVF